MTRVTIPRSAAGNILETKYTNNLCKAIEETIRSVRLPLVASRYIPDGTPDRFLAWPPSQMLELEGYNGWVEFKGPDTVITPDQTKTHLHYRACGLQCEVARIKTAEEGVVGVVTFDPKDPVSFMKACEYQARFIRE